MDVFVQWKNTGKISKYEFDNTSSKYAWSKYRESIEKKGGVVLDALGKDFEIVDKFRKENANN